MLPSTTIFYEGQIRVLGDNLDELSSGPVVKAEMLEISRKHYFLEYATRYWIYYAEKAESSNKAPQSQLLRTMATNDTLQLWQVLVFG